jgi:starch phosphorylase
VPVYFLDSNLPENSEWDRTPTHFLYEGDQHCRSCQEVILGVGGVRMLRALGYESIKRFHMNEGHVSLLALKFLGEEVKKAGRDSITEDDVDAVRENCVFTTHAPVSAGHDQFPIDLARRVIGSREDFFNAKHIFSFDGLLNMTYLALN